MATVRNWVGGRHNFFAASSWTPTGRPVAGDTAVIGLGTAARPNVAVVQNATLSNIAVLLDDGASTANPLANPTLSLSNTVIASGTSIAANVTFNFNPHPFLETIKLDGLVLNRGTISESGFTNRLNITLGNNAVLSNQGGTISAADVDTLNIEGGRHSALVNNGTISGHGATIDVGVRVSGNGVFDLTDDHGFLTHDRSPSTLEFHQAVGSGQMIAMTDSLLVLASPLTFLATIDDRHVSTPGEFAGNSAVLLKGEQATGLSFQNNVLTVLSGNHALAHLGFAPGLTAADFAFNSAPGGIGLPADTFIQIRLPPTGAASSQVAQASSIGIPTLQSHA